MKDKKANLKLVRASRRVVLTKGGPMPEPGDVVREARKVRAVPHYMGARDYLETVVILRDRKRFTWPEIVEWLAERGAEFSVQSLQMIYRRHELAKARTIRQEAKAL